MVGCEAANVASKMERPDIYPVFRIHKFIRANQ